MNGSKERMTWMRYGILTLAVIVGSGCSSNSDSESNTDANLPVDESSSVDESATTDESTTTDEMSVTDDTAETEDTSTSDETVGTNETSDTEDTSSTDETATTDETTTNEPITNSGILVPVFSCEEIATKFVTKGSANVDLPEPSVSASCVEENVVINSNQIPDFPYIVTSPGNPQEYDLEFTIPAVPTVAEEVSAVPAIGALGVAINGIPIYGATEGAGGDVLSLGGGFTECGGHNGPTGYHYHTFDVDGSDYCLFSEAQASAEPQLFGYALDGYPIYSGNFQYTSSWYLSDPSLFATDTFSAHTFVEGSGDLDQCNGRTDEAGNYAYYTTDSFPYTLGCYRGVVEVGAGGGGGGGPGGPR